MKPSIALIAACTASTNTEKSIHWCWNVLLRRVSIVSTSHKRWVEAKNLKVVMKVRIPFTVGSLPLLLISAEIKASRLVKIA